MRKLVLIGLTLVTVLSCLREAQAAMAFVRSGCKLSTNKANTETVQFGVNCAGTGTATAPTQGDLLIVIASNATSTTGPTTPTGWTPAISEVANAPGQVIFYKIADAGESSSLTISGYGSNVQIGLMVLEFSGISSPTLDKTASHSGASGTAPDTGTTATTTDANEILIAGLEDDDGGSFGTLSNSFTVADTKLQSSGNKIGIIAAYKVVSATGAYTTAGSTNATGNWRGQIVTFKTGSGRRSFTVE